MSYMYNNYTNASFFVFPKQKNFLQPNYSQIWISAGGHTEEFSLFVFSSTSHCCFNLRLIFHKTNFHNTILGDSNIKFFLFSSSFWTYLTWAMTCIFLVSNSSFLVALFLSLVPEYLLWSIPPLGIECTVRSKHPTTFPLSFLHKLSNRDIYAISFGDPRLSTPWDLSSPGGLFHFFFIWNQLYSDLVLLWLPSYIGTYHNEKTSFACYASRRAHQRRTSSPTQ